MKLDQTSMARFQLAESDRKGYLVVFLGVGPILLGSLLGLALVVSHYRQDPLTDRIALYALMGVMVAGFGYLLRALARSEWLRATFEADEQGICKRYPSGRCESGRWSDLRDVRLTSETLEFGTSKIRLSYFPRSIIALSREEMENLADLSGRENPLHRALTDFRHEQDCKYHWSVRLIVYPVALTPLIVTILVVVGYVPYSNSIGAFILATLVAAWLMMLPFLLRSEFQMRINEWRGRYRARA